MSAGPAFRRILLIKPSSLGDIIHALPVLHGLRGRFPGAHIAWLVNREHAPLIAGHPHLNEVIEFDRRRYGRMLRHPAAALAFGRFVARLRRARFDLVVDLQGLFRSGFLALASGASRRVGFREAREWAWTFYNHRVPTSDHDTHAVDRNLGVLAALGLDPAPAAFDLAVNDLERRRAEMLLAREGIDASQPYLVVVPGARWETKRWSPDRFAVVIDALAQGAGLFGVLMGAPNERELCARVAGRCTSRTADLSGATNLRETAAALAGAAVVVGHDSAPMHMAVALGRPAVCLMGPTSRHRTGPYRGAVILQAQIPCAPCFLRHLYDCRHDHECMRQIMPEVVVAAVQKALAKADSGMEVDVPTVGAPADPISG